MSQGTLIKDNNSPFDRLLKLTEDFIRQMIQWEELSQQINSGDFIDNIYPVFSNYLDELFQKLSLLESEVRDNSSDIKLMRDYFRERTCNPWFFRSKYNKHAYTKPLGYAGDYEIIDMIYHQSVSTDNISCLFDLYFLKCAGAQAVIHRRNFISREISRFLSKTKLCKYPSVVNIGCGSAKEILDIYEFEKKNSVCFILTDTEVKALANARENLRQLLSEVKIIFRHENVIDYLRSSLKSLDFAFGKSVVLIYSIGVMDYIPDNIFSMLLKLFYDAIIPGGICLIGNFDPSNQSRTYMEWVGDWVLNYRDAEKLISLAKAACPEAININVTMEETQTNNFLSLQKPLKA